MNPINIFRLRTNKPAARTKIVLEQNLFTFLLAGEKTVHLAGTQITAQPHQFLLSTAGNCLVSAKVAAKNAPYHSLLISFDTVLLTDFFSRHGALIGQQTKRRNPQPFLLLQKDEFLVNYTRSLDNLVVDNRQLYPELQRVKLEELLIYLALHYPAQMQQIRDMSYESDEDLIVRQAVTSHINSNITVEELAFLCNMSLSSFKRRFARIYGNSPNKWLLEKRMETAAQLLRQHNRKASEIYYELGYENLSSFIQSFKQVHGITPKQYQLLK